MLFLLYQSRHIFFQRSTIFACDKNNLLVNCCPRKLASLGKKIFVQGDLTKITVEWGIAFGVFHAEMTASCCRQRRRKVHEFELYEITSGIRKWRKRGYTPRWTSHKISSISRENGASFRRRVSLLSRFFLRENTEKFTPSEHICQWFENKWSRLRPCKLVYVPFQECSRTSCVGLRSTNTVPLLWNVICGAVLFWSDLPTSTFFL